MYSLDVAVSARFATQTGQFVENSLGGSWLVAKRIKWQAVVQNWSCHLHPPKKIVLYIQLLPRALENVIVEDGNHSSSQLVSLSVVFVALLILSGCEKSRSNKESNSIDNQPMFDAQASDEIAGGNPDSSIVPHPDAAPNTHAVGEVDKPELVRFIVANPATLNGIVVDEVDATLTGKWQYSTHTPPYVGVGYLHDQKEDKGAKSVTFTPNLPHTGEYEVRISHCYNIRRATNTPVTIHHADGETTIRINQQETPKFEKLFRSVGRFRFVAGKQGWVRISNDDTDGKYVIADAVQFIPLRDASEDASEASANTVIARAGNDALAHGEKLFRSYCAACHQKGGQGVEGRVPPLDDSPWVAGSEDRIVRIVLNGLRGPIEIHGKTYNLEMPAFRMLFKDDDIASILTYVRNRYGKPSPPIASETVSRVRQETEEHVGYWTVKELMLVP